MPHFNCIITGCSLEYGGAHYHGDLFEFDGHYLFNAVHQHGEAIANPAPTCDRALIVFFDAEVFERRGVFVIPKMAAALNDAARTYVGPQVPFSSAKGD